MSPVDAGLCESRHPLHSVARRVTPARMRARHELLRAKATITATAAAVVWVTARQQFKELLMKAPTMLRVVRWIGLAMPCSRQMRRRSKRISSMPHNAVQAPTFASSAVIRYEVSRCNCFAPLKAKNKNHAVDGVEVHVHFVQQTLCNTLCVTLCA